MSLEKFEFIPLTDDFELLLFHCKDDDLNSFLFDDAKHYLSELLAVTYLFIDPQAQKTVAYFSLLNDKVALDPEERSFWNRLNRRINNNKRRKTYPSVTNVGKHPTFHDETFNVETHVPNVDLGDAYDETVKIEFVKYIREIRFFEDKQELFEQIQKDIESVTEVNE